MACTTAVYPTLYLTISLTLYYMISIVFSFYLSVGHCSILFSVIFMCIVRFYCLAESALFSVTGSCVLR